jgi:hypoxanthine phosphoribosyltransferase
MDCEIMSWSSVAKLSHKLALGIQHDSFVPDIVVAIARGGYVPARILCDRLNIYNLTSIRITHYTGGSTIHEKARLSVPLCVDIRDMNVLLVDDVDDTGETIELALKHLYSFQPKMVKTAVLHHKTVSPLVPDYYAKTIRKWRWIIYPWALAEDITGFISRMSPKPKTLEEVRVRLEQDYGIRLSTARLEEIAGRVLR